MFRALFLATALVSLCHGGAHAEEPAPSKAAELIQQAAAAYTALDYDKALPLLGEAEKQPDLTTADRVTLLKYRAFIMINEGKEILAHDTIADIYKLEPDFELPATVSPKLRNFFAEVKKEIKPRVIMAKPAGADTPAPEQKVTGAATQGPNFFIRFWPSWTCLATGVGLLIPGTIIGLDATSGRDQLANAPKDASGRIGGMTYEEAKKLQSDADQKGVTADILIGAGAAALATGIVMFFVYDGAREVSTSTSVSFGTDGGTKVIRAAWAF